MPYRSSILNSSGLQAVVFAAVFCAVPLWAELELVPYYSGQFQEVKFYRTEDAQVRNKTILLLGDSTAARLRRVASSSTPWVNFSLGGASALVWELMAEKSLPDRPEVQQVAVMATAIDYGNDIDFAYQTYVPYLLSPADIYHRWRANKIDAGTAMSIVFQKYFTIYCSRSEIVYRLFSMEASLRPWMEELLRDRTHAKDPPPPPPPGLEFRNYELLAELTNEHRSQLTLLLSPSKSVARTTSEYARGRSMFQQVCSRLKLRCISLEESFPDSDFSEDGVHVKEELNEKLGLLVGSKLGYMPKP
ncbi:MAG: hypothetical protein ACXVB9_16165 [Bdellovibrionota bacterium]